jgi:hypothetical protein
MEFKRRVTVMAPNGRILFDATRKVAAKLTESGAALAHTEKNGMVSMLMLTGAHIPITDARPGSLGVHTETHAGHKIYQHNETWEAELAA